MSASIILIATLAMGDGRTLQLFDRSANCAYTWFQGSIVNSANSTILDLCWRVSVDEGRVNTTYRSSLRVEDFDWTLAGKAYLRKVTR